MKIGKFEVHWPFLREQKLSAIDVDTAKGIMSRTKNAVYEPKEIASYFDAYTDDDLIRAMVDDLAESVAGNGFYTSVETTTPVFQKSKAKEVIDHFGQYFNLDDKFPNIARLAIIAGFCPVETRLVANDVEKCALKIIHPKTVKSIEVDPQTNEILWITQKVDMKEQKIDGKELAWFTYGMLGNDVRGVSYVRGCIKLLNTLNAATDDVNAIFNRYLSPIGIWKTRRSTEALKAAADKREPGEDIFLGNLTEEEMKEEALKFLTVDPRVPFWEYIVYLDRRLYAYSRANNTWYSIQRSMASSDKIDDIIMRHVASIQRCLKRAAEKYWFAPLAKLYDLPEVPKLNWGKMPTGVENIAPSEIITKGIELGLVSPIQYADILKQIGIHLLEEASAPSGSAQVPSEEEPIEAVEPLIKEQHGLTGNTWGCPQCGYTLLNPFVSVEYIVCPRCGFEPYPQNDKSKYLEVLKSIIKKYNEEFGSKIENQDESED